MAILSSHMYDDVGDLLKNQPGNYFEIGVFDGEGIALLARQFTDKTIYAVDPFIEDGHTIARSNMTKGSSLITQRDNCLNNIQGLTNVILHEMTSELYDKNISSAEIAKMNVDVVAIDGNHHYESVIIDAELALRLLENRQGHIVFDDTDVAGVAQAYNEFIEQHIDRIANKFSGRGQVKI